MKVFTRFSLKNTLVIFLMVVMVIAGGLYSTSSVQQELMPNINMPFIFISTVYPGAAPEDVAETVSRPLEKAVSGLEGIKQINTTSNENISMLMMNFDYSKDMEKAEREIQDAINKVKLPDKVQKPTISKFSYGSIPVVGYSVTSEKDEEELSKIIKDKFQPALSGIKGVGNVSVDGVYNKNIFIRFDDKKIKENGVNLQNVMRALTANDLTYPAGNVDISGQTLPVKVSRKITTLNDIKSIPIIITPDVSKMMSGSMEKVINGMYASMGEMMQKASAASAGAQESIGKALQNNMQAVSLLAAIQKSQVSIEEYKQNLNTNFYSKQEIDRINGSIAKEQENIKNSMRNLNNILLAMQAMDQKPGKTTAGNTTNAAPSIANVSGLDDQNGTNLIKTVFLSDIADVVLDKPEGSSYTRENMKSTVILTIYKNEDANAVEIEKSVREKVDELQKDYPGFKLDKIDDSARYITMSIEGMVREGVLGALFAILIIALFLRNIRATVIAVISIPLSILIALILLPQLGISLNMMSLSGMAVATGRIVDDSIVVIENIFRRLQRKKSDEGDIIEDATGEVSSAITSSTITTVAVFLPLAFVNGMVGKVFSAFALTVVICIAASLLVAVTIVPVMSKFMLLKRPPKHNIKASKIEYAYKKVISVSLNHRIKVVSAAIVLAVVSIYLVTTQVGVKFLPADKTNLLSANLKLPAGASLEETNKEALRFEEFLKNNSDVKLVTSHVGDNSSSDGAALGQLQGTNEGRFTIVLNDKVNTDEAMKKIKEKAKELENGKSTWVIKPVDHYSGGERLEIVVNGDNVDDIKTASDLIEKSIKDIPEVSNIANNLSEKKPEIVVKVDSLKAAQRGLNPDDAFKMIRIIMSSDKITTVENDGRTIDVMMGMKKSDIDSIEKVENLELPGMPVKIKDIAEVKVQDGPVSISERDGKRFASITADLMSSDTAKVVQDISDKIEDVKAQFKPGVKYSIGGSMDDINETFSQMLMAMLIAIFLVFITMVLTFKEATAPFAILFSLPFAAVGALLALVITRHPLSMSGMVGMLMLIGIVVTNAIVLVDRVQSNRTKGMDIRDSLIEAGAVRLRPIIMTAAATIMALIPLAAGFSEGAIISEELGIVVIGGLLLSTVLTLVIVPVVYSLFESLKMRVVKTDKNMINV